MVAARCLCGRQAFRNFAEVEKKNSKAMQKGAVQQCGIKEKAFSLNLLFMQHCGTAPF